MFQEPCNEGPPATHIKLKHVWNVAREGVIIKLKQRPFLAGNVQTGIQVSRVHTTSTLKCCLSL